MGEILWAARDAREAIEQSDVYLFPFEPDPEEATCGCDALARLGPSAFHSLSGYLLSPGEIRQVKVSLEIMG